MKPEEIRTLEDAERYVDTPIPPVQYKAMQYKRLYRKANHDMFTRKSQFRTL